MCQDLNKHVIKTVNLNVVCHAPCVTGLSENKDIRPNQTQREIKCVKPVCCVNHCLYVPTVQNVPHVVQNPPVGTRLQRFWQVWHSLGANTRVVSILQEGYTLPFKEKPSLARSPVIISGYANPVKNKHIKDSLQALLQKQAVEKVTTPSSLAFYNRLFLVPKPNRKWRPILDLSRLNCYLATSSFKMETPETIRLSLQKGGFQRRLLPYPNRTKVTEIPQVLPPQSSLSVHSSPLWPLNGSVGVHKGGQGSQVNGTGSGYQDPPVPR